MSDGPFGRRCQRLSIEAITTPAIYSVQRIAERSGMSEARVRALAAQRGVKLHRAGGTSYVRRTDIHEHMSEVHAAACRIEDPARMLKRGE